MNSYTNNKSVYCNITISDKKFSEKWLNLLKINSPKTYTPPDLTVFLTKKNLLPFFIGMIDGDGCIWKNKNWINLRIELHGNWLSTLGLISKNLKLFYDIDCKIKLSNRGYARLEINTKKDLKILKNFIHNVDFMNRKWEKCNIL